MEGSWLPSVHLIETEPNLPLASSGLGVWGWLSFRAGSCLLMGADISQKASSPPLRFHLPLAPIPSLLPTKQDRLEAEGGHVAFPHFPTRWRDRAGFRAAPSVSPRDLR